MKKSNVKVGGGKATTNMVTSDATNSKNSIQVMVFENPEFGRIRTTTSDNGEPLVCGKDVCEVLGYAQADKAIARHVEDLDRMKRTVKVAGSLRKDGSQTVRRQQMLFVNESGLYALVFGSKLETAQRFKHWVTSEVLPQIRKTGGYVPLHEGDTNEDIQQRAEEVLRATLEQKDSCIAQQKKLIAEQDERIRSLDRQVDEQLVRIQKSAEEILDLEHDVDRLLPKALYADSVLDSVSYYTTTQIAKELGMTAQELNRMLCAERVQYYQSGQYMLYAEYAHRGLAKSRTHFDLFVGCDTVHTRVYLVWTERGRKFIHQLAEA